MIMKRLAAAFLVAASVLLPATATATRLEEMRAFTDAFWRTMSVEVSQACRGVVGDVMHTIAGQSIGWGADVFYRVVEQTKVTLFLTPLLNAPEVMSNLEWADCREQMLIGLNTRQLTPQEAAGKAEQDRLEAERKRRLEEAKRFSDSCEAQGGYVDSVRHSTYIDGRDIQLECHGLEAARERARKKQECLRGGGAWEWASRTAGYKKCRCADVDSTWNTSLKRCETYDERYERRAKKRCLSEVGATWDPSNESLGPCVTPKEKRVDERDRKLTRCRKAYESANNEQYDQRRTGAIDQKEFKARQSRIRSTFKECERLARSGDG